MIVRSHPDSQCVSHRRSYRSAAGQIWETSFWLEITFFSFSAPRLSSFRLPPLPRSPCLLCLLPQIDRDSWGTEPSNPVASMFLQRHADLHTANMHIHTNTHALLQWLPPSRDGVGTQYSTCSKSKRKLRGTPSTSIHQPLLILLRSSICRTILSIKNTALLTLDFGVLWIH